MTLRCQPNDMAIVTRALAGTDLKQLLGRVVRVIRVTRASALGPMWELERPEHFKVTKPALSLVNGVQVNPGDAASIRQLPDVWLTPLPKQDDPGNEWDESELDSERSFEVEAPSHA